MEEPLCPRSSSEGIRMIRATAAILRFLPGVVSEFPRERSVCAAYPERGVFFISLIPAVSSTVGVQRLEEVAGMRGCHFVQ